MIFFVGFNLLCCWIVNFDVDFMDGFVLVFLVGVYVLFVVSLLLFVYSVFINYFIVYIVVLLFWISLGGKEFIVIFVDYVMYREFLRNKVLIEEISLGWILDVWILVILCKF